MPSDSTSSLLQLLLRYSHPRTHPRPRPGNLVLEHQERSPVPRYSLSRPSINTHHGKIDHKSFANAHGAHHTSQTSIGTGYDLSNSVFSPDGRNFQVEYAVKAVENGGTAIGIRCKDGVVLALEKLVTSRLLKKDANKRIATVDRNAGVVCSARTLPNFTPPSFQK